MINVTSVNQEHRAFLPKQPPNNQQPDLINSSTSSSLKINMITEDEKTLPGFRTCFCVQVFTISFRPPLEKVLFLVERPGGNICAEWGLFFLFSIVFFQNKSAFFLPKIKGG